MCEGYVYVPWENACSNLPKPFKVGVCAATKESHLQLSSVNNKTLVPWICLSIDTAIDELRICIPYAVKLGSSFLDRNIAVIYPSTTCQSYGVTPFFRNSIHARHSKGSVKYRIEHQRE